MTLFTLFFTKVTRKTLNDRFSKGQTEALIEDMWQQYNELSPDLLDGISPTGKFLMKTSGGALALFHTLVNHGTEEGEARQIIADVNWSLIGGGSPLRKGMIRLQYELTRIVGRDPVKRLDWCLAPLWRFIFTMPPVIRCPWADYFRSVGQPELGATAFCDIDFKLAEIWGFDLKRNGLLMTGAPCCDFRFTPKNK
jgi:ubiquinone biosynthesis protein